MYEWVTLYNRLGGSISNPSSEQMSDALSDLFANPQDPEHFECWIECGSEDGRLLTYTVTSNGTARITTFSDVDMTDELNEEVIEGITQESALSAWRDFIGK